MKIPRQNNYPSLHWKFTHGQKGASLKLFASKVELVISLTSPRCSRLTCWAPKSFVWTSIISNFFKRKYWVLITCQALYIHTGSYSILPTMPKSRSYYHPQIINEETEAQRGYELAQGHTARNEQSQGLNWVSLSSELWTPGAASHCHLREPTSKLCTSVRFSLVKKQFLGSRGLMPASESVLSWILGIVWHFY